jgi:hypothetical protein
MLTIAFDKRCNLAKSLGIRLHVLPARVRDKPETGSPQQFNLLPLLDIGLLWRFESSPHPMQRPAALGASGSAFF